MIFLQVIVKSPCNTLQITSLIHIFFKEVNLLFLCFSSPKITIIIMQLEKRRERKYLSLKIIIFKLDHICEKFHIAL